jgi:Beta-propeller repeat
VCSKGFCAGVSSAFLIAAVFISNSSYAYRIRATPRSNSEIARSPLLTARLAQSPLHLPISGLSHTTAPISVPIAFEPNVGQAGAKVQYVGRGSGTTVVLLSDGIELSDSGGRTLNGAGPLKLQFVSASPATSAPTVDRQSRTRHSASPKRKRRSRASSVSHPRKPSGKRRVRRRISPAKQKDGLKTDRPRKPAVPRPPKPKSQPGSFQINPSNHAPAIVWHATGKLPGETNYILNNNPALWRTHVPHFQRAGADNVLPGVNVVAYGTERGLEYDLRFAPGAHPEDVRLRIAASNRPRLDRDGDLVMAMGGQQLRMKRPVIYEESAAKELAPNPKHVDGGYEIEADGTIGFRLGAYDHSATLVIDPSLTLAYSTFLGGSGSDSANSIALDVTGKIYVGGTTSSASTFPETSGTDQGPGGGPSDFFIAKIDPTQSGAQSLIYLTFIGGSGDEEGGSIAVDGSGNVAITGTSTSVDYPVTDMSVLTVAANGSPVNDAAVTEIGPSGATLVYSTLFGGNGNEGTLSRGGIALDPTGDIYVVMDTQSTNLTTVPTAAQAPLAPFGPTYGGGVSDAFLAIFNPLATTPSSHLKYCTYLGINAQATATGVAVDSAGNAYIAGYTSNPLGTLNTTNGFQTTYAAAPDTGENPYDAFVMKILPLGNGLEDLGYGTFLGGSGSDKAFAIALDSQLPPPVTVYVTGTTQSSNFPVTVSGSGTVEAYQSVLQGAANAFLAVIPEDPATGLTRLAYSTFLGGSETDTGLGVWVAAANRVYVTGSTSSWDFPWQFNLQPFTGDGDAFVTELDPTTAGNAALLISTPLGGTSQPGLTATAAANGIAVDTSGNVYLAGATAAPDFPRAGSAGNGFQLTCSSCQQTPPLTDAFIVKIAQSTAAMPSVSFSLGKVNFGTQPVGSLTVPPQAIAIENTGDSPLTISSVILTGANSADFSAQNSVLCTTLPVAPGGMCAFEITFVPSVVGPEGAFLTLTDNAAPGSQILEVVGVGGGPLASFTPASVNFSNVPVGTNPASPILVTNTGNQALLISNIQVTGANASLFPTTSGGCPGTSGNSGGLQPGASCTVVLSFDPNAPGTYQAGVTFTDNSQGASNSTQVVPIEATATPATALLSVNPPSLAFATQAVGTTSGLQIVTLSNVGSAPLNLTNLAMIGGGATSFGYFTRGSNACQLPPGTLAPGTNCTIVVDFIPQAAGSANAALTFTDNAAGSPQMVALSGIGAAATEISVKPDSVAFGTQSTGLTSPPVTITVLNTGNYVMSFAPTPISMSPANAEFAQTNTCASTLGPKASCLINVTFNAQRAGTWATTLFLNDDAVESPQAISLSATSIAVSASITPAGTIHFGNLLVGTTSAPMPVTIRNSGVSPSVLKVLGTNVADAADFKLTNNCSASIPAAGSCALDLVFDPASVPASSACGSTAGAKSTALTITDNAPNSPQSIPLSGTATDYCVEPPGLTTQTVAAGGSVTYSLEVASFGGFAETVNLSCTDAAAESNCTPEPGSVTVTDGAPIPFQVTVTTAAGSSASSTQLRGGLRVWVVAISSIVLIASLFLISSKPSAPAPRLVLSPWLRVTQAIAVAFFLGFGLAACFGHGNAASTAGTASGSYTLTVTATYGTATRSLPLTLVVQ